ncbi:MAG: radical SAM protein [Bacteroidota bacterium]|nr:radical SAM protein [Bacteroidota bacterium]
MNYLTNCFSKTLVSYIDKNPVSNAVKVLRLMEKLSFFSENKPAITKVKNTISDPLNPWNEFFRRFKSEVNDNSRKKFLSNFLLNGCIMTTNKKERLRHNLSRNIPWTLLIDPTSACNLHCTGCWAADYSRTDQLSYEQINCLINEAKQLSIHFFLFSGGEPLLRKDDLLRLCREHNDSYFIAFTNGTLVDDKLAEEIAQVGNFALLFSIDGMEASTDERRGKGTYRKVLQGMKSMRKFGNLFGFSTTYHRYNTEEIGSEEFMDLLESQGCRFGWYFTYIPIGRDAHPDYIVTPLQRKLMYEKVREFRRKRPLFLLDFWNDAEYIDGCVAGGRYYCHINAKGDAEPCAFIHYSNANIREMNLLDILNTPLFQQYRKNQPFNKNMLRPCPCLDNPHYLVQMVNESGAFSTQDHGGEKPEALARKCLQHAEGWGPVADELWDRKGTN